MRTQKRQDPITAILNRLDSMSAELSTTVNTSDIADMVKKGDMRIIQDRLDAQEVEITDMKRQLPKQQDSSKAMSQLIDQNTAASLELGQQSAELRTRLVDQQPQLDRPPTERKGNTVNPKRLNIIIEGARSNSDNISWIISLAIEIGIKGTLKKSERFGDIWINPDDTLEVRKLNSTFRKVAYRVRQEGHPAYFNHESIQIDDDI